MMPNARTILAAVGALALAAVVVVYIEPIATACVWILGGLVLAIYFAISLAIPALLVFCAGCIIGFPAVALFHKLRHGRV